MEQQREILPHRITLDDRKKLSLTGVTQVDGFDENEVLLTTGFGRLRVHGSDLKLKNLSPESGQVLVVGQIDALFYETQTQPGGFFRRIFR